MKIVTIIGARPQFIKTKLISKLLRLNGFNEIIIHTGQHYDFNMSEVFFTELELPVPDYNLGINNGNHGEQTGRMLIKIEEILIKEKPNLVVVYGDTNSTLAGALAASKLQIPVAHVEAGLRSFNRAMPEELNRVITDSISSLLFTPSIVGKQHLIDEGITQNIYITGDVMYDVVLDTLENIDNSAILDKYGLLNKNFVLCTIHRAENSDNKEFLEQILLGINRICELGINVIFPIHPRTRKSLEKFDLWDVLSEKIQLINPVVYSEMIVLESNAKLIITDSGGVQKEAYYLNTPCIIPRNETEWTELVEIGSSFLTGASCDKIYETAQNVLSNKSSNSRWDSNIYGNGNSSTSIVSIIKDFLSNRPVNPSSENKILARNY